jgi:hypothetical protein
MSETEIKVRREYNGERAVTLHRPGRVAQLFRIDSPELAERLAQRLLLIEENMLLEQETFGELEDTPDGQK